MLEGKKTYIGILVMLLSGLLAKYGVSADVVGDIVSKAVDTYSALTLLIGAGVAVWGRIHAAMRENALKQKVVG